MNNNTEQWLTLRDKKTKKFVKQIKLESSYVSQEDFQNYLLGVKNMIDGIDSKYMTIIQSSITYHFQGLIDIYNGESIESLSIVKYNLQSELLKLIDATNIDLNLKICNPYDIRKIINLIINIYNISHIISKETPSGTSNQDLIIEEKINFMVNQYNQYLTYLEAQYDWQKKCLVFTIPQTFIHALQISSAIDTTNFNINEVKLLYIEEKKLIG
jgi:hypothetical protein